MDLSKYECVYISYGSKQQVTEHSKYQRYPDFLNDNTFFSSCVTISIDAYEAFTLTPLNPHYANGDDIEIPSHSPDDLIAITRDLVDALDRYKIKHVYIFNFIKIKDISHETPLEVFVNEQLPIHLGKYTNNLYHWMGYNAYVNGEFHQIGLVDWVCKHSCLTEPTYWSTRLVRRDFAETLREGSWETMDETLNDLLKHAKDKEEKKEEFYKSFINIVTTLMQQFDQFQISNVLSGGRRRKSRSRVRTRRKH